MEMEFRNEIPRYSEQERRQLLRREFRGELLVLRDEAKDPRTRRFAEIVLEVLSLKEMIEARMEEERRKRVREGVRVSRAEKREAAETPSQVEHDKSGADASGGATRKPPQQFGIFWAVEGTAEFDIADPESQFDLRVGDSYIELHLPPVDSDDKTLAKATSSLQELADYVRENELTPKYIYGITYERLANDSRRFGFEKVGPGIFSEELNEGFARFSRMAVREGLKDEPMGDLMLVYQSGEDFLSRFSPRETQAGGE